MATVTICSDFGAPQIKSDTVSTVSPSICYEVTGPVDEAQAGIKIPGEISITSDMQMKEPLDKSEREE